MEWLLILLFVFIQLNTKLECDTKSVLWGEPSRKLHYKTSNHRRPCQSSSGHGPRWKDLTVPFTGTTSQVPEDQTTTAVPIRALVYLLLSLSGHLSYYYCPVQSKSTTARGDTNNINEISSSTNQPTQCNGVLQLRPYSLPNELTTPIRELRTLLGSTTNLHLSHQETSKPQGIY